MGLWQRTRNRGSARTTGSPATSDDKQALDEAKITDTIASWRKAEGSDVFCCMAPAAFDRLALSVSMHR